MIEQMFDKNYIMVYGVERSAKIDCNESCYFFFFHSVKMVIYKSQKSILQDREHLYADWFLGGAGYVCLL